MLFWRFLKFGLLAWGGPVAQIAMIRQELVDDEKWITNERFNRILAVYQVLPGPEAHELCVYFGMLSRGRLGAFLAGLAFMLPGFLLMFLLSWFYVAYGIRSPVFQAIFLGMQPAVAALIVRAVHRIGGHALRADRWLWGIALIAGIAQLLGANFLIAWQSSMGIWGWACIWCVVDPNSESICSCNYPTNSRDFRGITWRSHCCRSPVLRPSCWTAHFRRRLYRHSILTT
jgi:chromate transporter